MTSHMYVNNEIDKHSQLRNVFLKGAWCSFIIQYIFFWIKVCGLMYLIIITKMNWNINMVLTFLEVIIKLFLPHNIKLSSYGEKKYEVL